MSASRTPVVADPVVVAAGTTAADAVAAAGLPAAGPKAIVVVREVAGDGTGQLRDLDWAPEVDTEVEPVSLDSPDGLNVLRHSTAHVLAQAVQDLFPEAKLGIGPPIENGFYYDFDVAEAVPAGGSRQAREADAGDHQVRAAVPPPPLRQPGRGPDRAGRRAVQAGADRGQGGRRDGGAGWTPAR